MSKRVKFDPKSMWGLNKPSIKWQKCQKAKETKGKKGMTEGILTDKEVRYRQIQKVVITLPPQTLVHLFLSCLPSLGLQVSCSTYGRCTINWTCVTEFRTGMPSRDSNPKPRNYEPDGPKATTGNLIISVAIISCGGEKNVFKSQPASWNGLSVCALLSCLVQIRRSALSNFTWRQVGLC